MREWYFWTWSIYFPHIFSFIAIEWDGHEIHEKDVAASIVNREARA